MDEGLLNDLLECSVCLERLDTSSRVLPCQHTFCLKCLKEIVDAHKELRCPECRVLVDARVEELPPNVLLMRILEGMRNSAPKAGTPSGKQHQASQLGREAGAGGVGGVGGARAGADCKQPPHARAVYDYLSKEPGDLSFKKGDVIYLKKKLDPFWYQGECAGRSGMFPITYVQVLVGLGSPPALCKALYDFRMSAPDEEGCLAFDKGAVIAVQRRVDENWAEGRLDERVGIFPIAFVECNHAASQLLSAHRTTIGRAVPPIPPETAHRHALQHRHQQMVMSAPAPAPNYQNVGNMSQSHPNYTQPLADQGLLVPQRMPQTLLPQTLMPKHNDLIHFATPKGQTLAVQNLRIHEGFDRRTLKDFNTPTHYKTENTYQNVRIHEHFPVSIGNFNASNSDSSSSVTTPSAVSSVASPNTSNTSSSESTEPSSPSSPDAKNQSHAAKLLPNSTKLIPNATKLLPMAKTQPNSQLVANLLQIQAKAALKAQNPALKAQSQNLENSIESCPGHESLTSANMSLNESCFATNTSLNVSLPDEKSTNQSTEDRKSTEEKSQDVASSSKTSRQNDLMSFGLGLQAALSPSHLKDGRQREREKRHSLTPGGHLQTPHQHNTNRHSAEIVATSLLDAVTSRERGGGTSGGERSRRMRSGSGERALPAAYVALYPYAPQKPDELELKKGGTYIVTERCRDGWYRGRSERGRRCGVFPGNYVAPQHTTKHDKASGGGSKGASVAGAGSAGSAQPAEAAQPAPDAPPRVPSPHVHAPSVPFPWAAQSQAQAKSAEKSKEKGRGQEREREREEGRRCASAGAGLMKRLAAMKRGRSPPHPHCYSIDNPVFEDCVPPAHAPPPLASHAAHPVHVRSGSCPSQLLGVAGLEGGAGGGAGGGARGAGSQRAAHKERPALAAILNTHAHAHVNAHAHDERAEGAAWAAQAHRKSQSLDASSARRDRSHSHHVKERFKCIAPYPPNSEYELELRVDDIVLVHRKRSDGWYKGTLQRTGRTGLFPASFVQPCPQH